MTDLWNSKVNWHETIEWLPSRTPARWTGSFTVKDGELMHRIEVDPARLPPELIGTTIGMTAANHGYIVVHDSGFIGNGEKCRIVNTVKRIASDERKKRKAQDHSKRNQDAKRAFEPHTMF